MVSQVSLFAESPATHFADARLVSRVDSLVPVDGEDAVKRLVTVPALKLSGEVSSISPSGDGTFGII